MGTAQPVFETCLADDLVLLGTNDDHGQPMMLLLRFGSLRVRVAP